MAAVKFLFKKITATVLFLTYLQADAEKKAFRQKVKTYHTDLVRLIAESTMAADGNNVKNIDKLLGRIRKQLPHHLELANRAATSFAPHLVINVALQFGSKTAWRKTAGRGQSKMFNLG